MKISLLEMDIVWGNPYENIQKAEQLVTEYGPSDLYILPEMWSTGFIVNPDGVAEEEASSQALAWMKECASSRQCAVSGSLAIKDGGNYYNRHYFVTPDSVVFYDKRHLFSYGGEDQFYTCGNNAIIATWKDFRFLLQTCYDLRFPVFSRYGRAGEYDAIIYVANWPQSRMQAWDILTKARAIENQCYVLAVNRTGNDPNTCYVGGSIALDPRGQCIPGRHVDLSLDRLQQMRSRFRVLDDRD